MHRINRFTLTILTLPLALTACDSAEPSDPEGPGEMELITTVIVDLDNRDAAGDDVTITVADDSGLSEDGTTFNVPLNLTAGATYDGSIRLRDESDPDDAEEITEEIRAEASEHQFFYVVDGVDVTVDYADEETDYDVEEDLPAPRAGVPVGLRFTVEVADDADGSGTLRIVLGHYDERSKNPSEDVDDVPETDVDFRVPLNVSD